MSEQENVEILRRAYALWNDTKADSVAQWLDLIADDVKWRSIADGAAGMEFTGECNNKAAVQRYFAELGSQWAMNYYTVHEFIAQGDRVVMVGRCGWKNRKTGATLDTPKIDIIRMRDSRIAEFFELTRRESGAEAAEAAEVGEVAEAAQVGKVAHVGEDAEAEAREAAEVSEVIVACAGLLALPAPHCGRARP